MALITYFQAKDHDKGLVLLPTAMLARFQHGTTLFNTERGTSTPSDLPGRRIDRWQHRHRAVRKECEPALPRIADIVLRAAKAHLTPVQGRRTLVTILRDDGSEQ
jgi:hypothetical protein